MTRDVEHHLADDLEAMADGGEGLSAARRDALQQHIATCEACQCALQETQAALSALRSDALEPSAGFDAALFAKLDAIDAAQAQTLWTRVQQYFTLPQLYAVGAVAAIALIIVVVRPFEGPGNPAAPAPLARAELMDLAQDQEMYESLELLRELDVLEDLEIIEMLEVEEG